MSAPFGTTPGYHVSQCPNQHFGKVGDHKHGDGGNHDRDQSRHLMDRCQVIRDTRRPYDGRHHQCINRNIADTGGCAHEVLPQHTIPPAPSLPSP